VNPELYLTADGSHTLYIKELDETYHSRNGAIEESRYVFIDKGFNHWRSLYPEKESIHIFEVGFGSGLNAWLFSELAKSLSLSIHFSSIEKFPISPEIAATLNYPEQLGFDETGFHELHQAPWNQAVSIHSRFQLKKINADFLSFDWNSTPTIDLVLMDAFGPDKQPEMWEAKLLENLFQALNPGAVWVTYSSKGEVKRSLRNVGFNVERLQGPPRKKHMLRASKP